VEQATLSTVDAPPSVAANGDSGTTPIRPRGFGERLACRRLRKLGLNDEAIADLKAAERQRIAAWTAPSQLTGSLYVGLALSLVVLFDVLRPWHSVAAAFAAVIALGVVTWLWVGIAYVSWKATERWGDPDRRLGLAARRYLLNKSSTQLDRRTAVQRVKWSMRRELQRSTGFVLRITDSQGDELAVQVRDVLIAHAKGGFVSPTVPPTRPDLERRSVNPREWSAIAAGIISVLAAVVKLLAS